MGIHYSSEENKKTLLSEIFQKYFNKYFVFMVGVAKGFNHNWILSLEMETFMEGE